VDDDALIREMLRETILYKLHADSASCVLGETSKDCRAVLELACAPACQADLIILDENLDYPPNTYLKGSCIARQLRQRGFTGVICAFTGGSLEKQRELAENHSIDRVLNKGQPLQEIVDSLAHALSCTHAVQSRSGDLVSTPADDRVLSSNSQSSKQLQAPAAAWSTGDRLSRFEHDARHGAAAHKPPTSPRVIRATEGSVEVLEPARDSRAPHSRRIRPPMPNLPNMAPILLPVPPTANESASAAAVASAASSQASAAASASVPVSPRAATPPASPAPAPAAAPPESPPASPAPTSAAAPWPRARPDSLLDMSPLDGLPPQSVSRLVAMFHDLLPAKPGAPLVSATQQLDAIEANLLRGGAMWKDRDIQYRLHQLAGSSLQAGAAALGRSIRELKEAIANEQVIDAAEGVRVLRELLRDTHAELKTRGV
jgi:hypothetical protein